MSQSGEVMVCAHAAVWGVCRFLSQRFNCYPELYPHDLILMTATTGGRRAPYRGMTYADYSKILTEFGCHPVIVRPRTPNRDWQEDVSRFHDLYSYVESGFPVLASFKGHVSTIIGHTLRANTGSHKPEVKGLLPNVDVYNSFALIENYVVIDDNFFPYQLLGYRGDTRNYGRKFKETDVSIDGLFAAVVPLPEKVYLQPEHARELAYESLKHESILPLMKETLESTGVSPRPLVARLFLTSGTSFKRRKLAQFESGGDRLALIPVNLALPHFVWVMEIGPLARYNNGFAAAELVFDATAGPRECEYIYARVGRWLIPHSKKPMRKPEWSTSEFRLYTHNLGERDV